MKRIIALALFAMAGATLGGFAAAQNSSAHLQTVQFSPNYLQRGSCNVNGVVYPVGQDFRVWGYDANGNAWVIGWVNWRHDNIWLFHGSQGGVFEVPCW